MSKVKFKCPCGKKFQTDAGNAGREVKCPNCGAPNTVPAAGEKTPSPRKPAKAPKPTPSPPEPDSPVAAVPSPAAPPKPMKACPYCSESILLTALKCRYCQSHLGVAGESAGQPQARPGETLGMFMLVIPAAVILFMWIWFANTAEAGRVAKLHWLMAGTIIVTAVFAAVEALKLGMGRPADVDREGKRQSGPIAWFFFVALLWPVCYPAYLRRRRHYKLKSLLFLSILSVLAIAATYCFWSPGIQESFRSLYEKITGLFTSGE